jgi:DNA mismatch endonuclease (patch repair protein)
MVDRLTKEQRSWNMARIKGKDTGPEIFVRFLLHRAGYRFRKSVKGLPGKPDIVLPKLRMFFDHGGCVCEASLLL